MASTETPTIPKIVSVDDHVVEPAHVWARWLPERFRDRGPRVERRGLAGLRMVGPAVYEHEFDDDAPPCDIWFYEDLVVPLKRHIAAVGFDAAINYRTDDVAARLRATCPDGIDVFFDNVGGAILDTVLTRLAIGGRVALCGAISNYNALDDPTPLYGYMQHVVKRARIQGFLLLDYLDRIPEAVLQLVEWVGAGRLRWRDHIVDGLDAAPRALNMLFTGENTGKLMVRVDPSRDPTPGIL